MYAIYLDKDMGQVGQSIVSVMKSLVSDSQQKFLIVFFGKKMVAFLRICSKF